MSFHSHNRYRAAIHSRSEAARNVPPWPLPLTVYDIPYEGTWLRDANGNDVDYNAIVEFINACGTSNRSDVQEAVQEMYGNAKKTGLLD